MIRTIALVSALVFAVPAMAQQATLQQQVDSAAAEATAVIANMRGSIMQQAAHIALIEAQNDALNKQVAALTKERDDLKAAQPTGK